MSKIQLTNDNIIIEQIEFINNGNKITDQDIINLLNQAYNIFFIN